MEMFNPPHPGEFIRETYLIPFGLSERAIACKLDVWPSTFNRLISGGSSVTPEMALKLSAVLGRSPSSWLMMQAQYDLANKIDEVDVSSLERINFDKLDNDELD